MNLRKLIKDYLKEAKLMQLATKIKELMTHKEKLHKFYLNQGVAIVFRTLGPSPEEWVHGTIRRKEK